MTKVSKFESQLGDIMKDCTILVNSCDKYEDAWDPFFRLLKIQWPDCPYNIVLSTETKTYRCDFLNICTINSDPDLSWSSRLKYVLNKIETEYILFFLEDFFLLEKVRTDIFDYAFNKMKADRTIGLITFNKKNLGSTFPEQTNYPECFLELDKSVKGRTNVLVGLWRKEYYLKLLLEDENPWEYERKSNIRSRYAGYKVYTQNYDASHPAFRYCMNPKDGYGITQGKWLCKNKELFESHGILGVNYERLGVFESIITYESIQETNRHNNIIQTQKKRQLLSNQPLHIRLKETLYVLLKKIKKAPLSKKLLYYKLCIKYYFHYKKTK